MKTLQIIMIILLFAVNLTAQNVEPTQRPFNFKGNPNYMIDASNPEFKQSSFIIGGAWSDDDMTARIMLYNFGNTSAKSWDEVNGYVYYPPIRFCENCDLFLNLREANILTSGMSIQYEPTLKS